MPDYETRAREFLKSKGKLCRSDYECAKALRPACCACDVDVAALASLLAEVAGEARLRRKAAPKPPTRNVLRLLAIMAAADGGRIREGWRSLREVRDLRRRGWVEVVEVKEPNGLSEPGELILTAAGRSAAAEAAGHVR